MALLEKLVPLPWSDTGMWPGLGATEGGAVGQAVPLTEPGEPADQWQSEQDPIPTPTFQTNLEAPSHPQVSHVAICIPEPNREGDSEAGNFSLAKWTHHTFCIDFTDLQVPWWKGRLYEVLQFDTTSKRVLPYKILCNCVPF